MIKLAVCEYYVHGECVDFAAADCKENATYAAGSEIRHVHHWREGNLPANSKCAACRRACWSAECLTGYRCEWCGSTVRISQLASALRGSNPQTLYSKRLEVLLSDTSNSIHFIYNPPGWRLKLPDY